MAGPREEFAMFTFQALQLLLFLIPGLIALAVYNQLVTRRPHRSDLSYVAEALVYSMFVYAFYALITDRSAVSLDQTPQTVSISFDAISFIILILLSILAPIIPGVLVNKNVHTRLLSRLGISPKSARLSVWQDAFYDYKRHVVVQFEDGRRLYGWPLHYSDEADGTSLFLYRPHWLVDSDSDTELRDTGLDGMLITPNQTIHNIGFMPEDFEYYEEATEP
jgi:hypothetical protein